jgi:hypothetical protein
MWEFACSNLWLLSLPEELNFIVIYNNNITLVMYIMVFVNVWRKNIFDIYVTEYGTALTTVLPILFLCLNTVTVTAGTFEP